ncbi:MAG: hypothetical protein KA314_04565 [Chloroflexi bacterium]|nr:hypothetical protein [Chloroflexota bacterium]
MSKKKNHYYGWAQNDQGASLDITHDTSIRAVENEARRTLGSGWMVHVTRVDGDGHQGYMGETEVRKFRIR